MIKAKPLERGKRGDNSKVKAGPVAAGRLKSFVERVEKLEEERKAIGDDVRDVYAEAKGVGYDVKTIRWLVQERKVDAADRAERDSLRDTYAHALGVAVDLVQVEGLSLRQAEAATGVSKSSIQRALAVPAVSQVEMTADDLGEYIPPANGAAGEECLSGRDAPSDEHSNAALRGRVDDALTVVPPIATPQTAASDPAVTPVPDGGVGAGTDLLKAENAEPITLKANETNDLRPDSPPKPITSAEPDTAIDDMLAAAAALADLRRAKGYA